MSITTNRRQNDATQPQRPSRKRVFFDPKNVDHKKLLPSATNNPSKSIIKNQEESKPSKKIVFFGDDDEVKPDELDARGNIKDLIDYSDEKDYRQYEKAMKKRGERERIMAKVPHFVISHKTDAELDELDEEEAIVSPIQRDQESGEIESNEDVNEDSEEDEEEVEPLRIMLPFFMDQRARLDPQEHLQAKVLASHLPDNTKEMVIKRLENSDLDKPKQMEWIESLLSIPFGKYAIAPISSNDSQDKLRGFFQGVIRNFDSQVYGLNDVKREIIDYLAQFITAGPKSSPRTLALWGSAGCGKTHILRAALGEVLNRPMRTINMGGIKDTVYMTGFDYSYSSARYGVIVQTLIEKQVMNPIILFEEVDKISETKDGADIQNVLMQLTDPETNSVFQDKYFQGVDIDLSKAIMVFTLNDPSLVHPILLNRLHLVKVPDPTLQDKTNIGKGHMMPRILQNIGATSDFISVPDDIYAYILSNYCEGDKGVRGLKKCLETIALRLNTIHLIGSDLTGRLNVKFPLHLTREIVDSILHRPERPPIFDTMMYS